MPKGSLGQKYNFRVPVIWVIFKAMRLHKVMKGEVKRDKKLKGYLGDSAD